MSIILVKNYFWSGPALRPAVTAPAIANASVGNNLKSQLPGVDWSGNGETVLLALSTHCHFCTESAPFFRELGHKSGKAFKIVAVLPESVTESQDYLKGEGVHVDQLRQMSLEKLGIAGTPTMLLVNGSGIVTQTWVGELPPNQRDQALKDIASVHVEKRGGEL